MNFLNLVFHYFVFKHKHKGRQQHLVISLFSALSITWRAYWTGHTVSPPSNSFHAFSHNSCLWVGDMLTNAINKVMSTFVQRQIRKWVLTIIIVIPHSSFNFFAIPWSRFIYQPPTQPFLCFSLFLVLCGNILLSILLLSQADGHNQVSVARPIFKEGAEHGGAELILESNFRCF